MVAQLETGLLTAEAHLGEEIDEIFEANRRRMELLAELERMQTADDVLREAQRDAILGELLDKNPHEAIREVVHSLWMVYQDRTITTRREGLEITEFATRDETNTWLDDHYVIVRKDGDVVSIAAKFGDFKDMGYAVRVEGEQVRVDAWMGNYEGIPLAPDEVRPDGAPNNYDRTLRDFYLRALTTAGIAEERLRTTPELAAQHDQHALRLLATEISA